MKINLEPLRKRINFIFRRYRLKDYKFHLIVTIMTLSIIGVFVVNSAKSAVTSRHIFGLFVGVIAMLILSLIDYIWIANLYWALYGMNIVMLLSVFLIGKNVNGATRWIDLGFVAFQPSELSKLILIIFFSRYFIKHKDEINSPLLIVKALLLLAIPLLLIFKQPDLSTTISIVLVFCVLIFLSGLSYKFIGTVLAIIIPVSVIFLSIVVQPNQNLLHDYQQKRILAWLYPEQYSTDEGYQQQNSIMAIGSGQVNGKGLNNNTTTSVKNGNYILEPQTDFIFAIVGEELGFVGCCVILFLLLLIVVQCIITGLRAKDTVGRFICCGIGAQIAFQSFINVGVASGVLPNTGIPLPFVSYGLSSLVSMFMGIGIVLNIGLQSKKTVRERLW